MKRFKVSITVLAVMMLAVCSQAWGDSPIELNETNFPDLIFRKYLERNFPTLYLNGKLCIDTSSVTKLETEGMDIHNLKGIEVFTNLTYLNCSNNKMRELYLSKNTSLQILDCHDNMINTLDLSANSALTTLSCNFTIVDKGESYEFNLTDFQNAYHLSAIELNDNTYLDVYTESPQTQQQYLISDVRDRSSEEGVIIRFPKDASKLTSIHFSPYGSIALNSVTVYPDLSVPPGTKPTIMTSKLDDAAVGNEYFFQIYVSGSSPFTWTTKGTLLSGLTFNDGLITGTPAKKGSKKITVTVENNYGKDSKTLTLSAYEPPEITTDSLKDATVGKKYSVSFKAKGTKPMTWKLDGYLPDGLTFDSSKGKLSGTPKKNTKYTPCEITVTASNLIESETKTFPLNVKAIAPEIKTKKLKDGTWNKPYNAEIKTKGTAPITLTLRGALPQGLTFNSDTGKITGTPTEACNDRKLTITATNMDSSTEQNYSLTIKAIAPKITTKKLSDATVNQYYKASIEATGTPYIEFKSDELPSWMKISTSGQITGIPTYDDFGKTKINIVAENTSKAAKKKFALNVLSAPHFSDNNNLKSGQEGKSYSHKFSVNGTKSITFSISKGTLPNGIVLDSSKGTLKGKPSVSGTFRFTVRAKNSLGQEDVDCTLEVTPKNGNKSSKTTSSEQTQNRRTESEAMNVNDNYAGAESFSEDIIIVAELPEVSVDVAGMYDFDVKLSDDVSAGAKLVWLANSSVPSDDDSIAEFHTSDGEDTAHVPDDRVINVSAWLNPKRVYTPAIAIAR